MKKLTKLAVWLLVGVGFLGFPSLVLAGTTINLGTPTDWGNLNFSFTDLMSAILRIILVVAAIIFFVMLLIGGIQWMTSGGDKAATEAARGKLTAALIGLVIVFAAWAIASLINAFFGVNIFNLRIPTIIGTKSGG